MIVYCGKFGHGLINIVYCFLILVYYKIIIMHKLMIPFLIKKLYKMVCLFLKICDIHFIVCIHSNEKYVA